MASHHKVRLKKKYTWIIFVFLIPMFFLLPKHIQRYVLWNFADFTDFQKFDNIEVKKGNYTFIYPEAEDMIKLSVPDKFTEGKNNLGFETFLEDHRSVAFLVIKNDIMVYETYFAGYESTSTFTTFSAAKSFVSALVGIAIDEGYIYSTSQSITFFLKEIESPEFDKITIEDLLNMRSGIDFNEGYFNPFAEMPKYYYGTNLLKYIKKLKVKEKPDLEYDYISVNTILLGLIVERATNTKLPEYLSKKIWQPLGMESDGSWSVDNMKDQTVKANCCINGLARDFAKFGSLYLKKGNWNGTQIVPERWVERSTSIINDSRDSQGYPYTYQWRVLENGCFFAKGILGQYIFVNPDQNLVFVRLGEKYGNVDWADFCLELSQQL
jgi:CubicO group peptidase (beta-lactamase class C family)